MTTVVAVALTPGRRPALEMGNSCSTTSDCVATCECLRDACRLVLADGNLYLGEVSPDGAPQGFGEKTWRDGGVFQGRFVAGLPNGLGVQTWPDGSAYAGEFLSGTPHGKGRMNNADGTIISGEFQNGLRVSRLRPPYQVPAGKDSISVTHTGGPASVTITGATSSDRGIALTGLAMSGATVQLQPAPPAALVESKADNAGQFAIAMSWGQKPKSARLHLRVHANRDEFAAVIDFSRARTRAEVRAEERQAAAETREAKRFATELQVERARQAEQSRQAEQARQAEAERRDPQRLFARLVPLSCDPRSTGFNYASGCSLGRYCRKAYGFLCEGGFETGGNMCCKGAACRASEDDCEFLIEVGRSIGDPL